MSERIVGSVRPRLKKNELIGRADHVVCGAFLLFGMVSGGSVAWTQSTTPDAQVEANVLKALASAPELADEAITTKTVYGTVTLTGNVRDEGLRSKAETLAANASGVKKVVDELTLAGVTSSAANQQRPAMSQSARPLVLQSDGTYGPPPAGQDAEVGNGQGPAPGSAPAAIAQRNNPDADQALDAQVQQQQQGGQAAGVQSGQQPPPAPGGQPGYPSAPADGGYRRPMTAPGYPPYPNNYPNYPAGGYPPNGNGQGGNGQPGPQTGYGQQPGYPQAGTQAWGGQVAGENVTVPSGAMIRVRVNRTLSSNHTQPGTVFDGIVVNDVVAGGAVAIPRGASVQGTVVDAKSSGALKGRGELSIQLTQVTLAGKNYPVKTELWAHHGGDKTIETINKTAGFGAVGALFGALAGGGVGAAVGGGVGAAAGLGSSATSGNGQVIIPSEGMVSFALAQPASVTTVSEQEMQRLAYGVAPGADPRYGRRMYPRVYAPGYPPAYYGAPYGAAGYPPY